MHKMKSLGQIAYERWCAKRLPDAKAYLSIPLFQQEDWEDMAQAVAQEAARRHIADLPKG